jgi:hypothetical protein
MSLQITPRRMRFGDGETQELRHARGCACCGVRYYRLWYDTITETCKCWACLTPCERDWRLPIYSMLVDANELPLRMQAWANLQENHVCRNEGGCLAYTS